MSCSRCALLRNFTNTFISRSPKTVVSSPINAASLGGIGVEFIAELPDLKL